MTDLATIIGVIMAALSPLVALLVWQARQGAKQGDKYSAYLEKQLEQATKQHMDSVELHRGYQKQLRTSRISNARGLKCLDRVTSEIRNLTEQVEKLATLSSELRDGQNTVCRHDTAGKET